MNPKAIMLGIRAVFRIIRWIGSIKSNEQAKQPTEAEKQATQAKQQTVKTAVANDIRVGTANSTQSDQRDNYHISKMTEAEKRVAQAQLKQVDKIALANDIHVETANVTQITIPVVTSDAETIPSQIRVVTANSTQIDQRDNDHTSEMTEAEKRAAQARIKQPDEIAVANDIRVETANATKSVQQDIKDSLGCLGMVVVFYACMSLISIVLFTLIGASTPQGSVNCHPKNNFTGALIQGTIGDENFCNYLKGADRFSKIKWCRAGNIRYPCSSW